MISWQTRLGSLAATEDEHFDPRLAALRLEFEAAHQFTSREFVGLIDDGDGVGRIRQPHASELDVAGDRVRRDRDRLDPSLRMFPRVPADEREPRAERHLADAKAHDAIGDVGW